MKKNLIGIGIGLIVLIGIFVYKKYFKNDAVEVTTEIAIRRNIIETVSANGKIQPEVEVKISPDVSGEVIELLVSEGDQVKKGDLLLKINPVTYLSALDRMVATVNNSKANLANIKARLAQTKAQFSATTSSFNRNQKLYTDGAVSQADFDNSKASFEAAKADINAAEESVKAAEFNVKSTEASLKEANDNLNKTSIFAPVGGTISKLNIEKGERVVGTSQMAGTELLRIANLHEMEVSVEVNENDIFRISLGDTALIEADAYLDRQFRGIITEIANSANTTGGKADQVTNFTVKIRILQESYADLISDKNSNLSPFRPGMSATVDIQTKKAWAVLSVPIQAVTTRLDSANDEKLLKSESGADNDIVVNNPNEIKEARENTKSKIQEYVFLFDNGVAKAIKIKTGIQDNNFIEIIEGLKLEQEVISGPYTAVSKTINDKSKVKKVDKNQLFNSVKN